jgi:hypothetical protein
VLAVFPCAERAEEAVNNLHEVGFTGTDVSVIARDDSSMQASRVPWWIRLRAELTGMAVVRGPGVGRVVALGPIARPSGNIASETQPAARSSGLAPLLMRAGISAGAASTYEAAIRGGQTLVLVHGSANQMRRARACLVRQPGRRPT